ncbi:MAG: hypothetical protein BJ554DRAFT_8149 [Olpidium bornovanus]|uniref:Uncharacterized protein n=1 Tax=Olpidium bornovanus TaxID=278681 RepID=A0A8H8DJA5_9FUNG|nr:MAG: hypothetical protein BJ554DRAFT_8149 [Olpidium bornovanus]
MLMASVTHWFGGFGFLWTALHSPSVDPGAFAPVDSQQFDGVYVCAFKNPPVNPRSRSATLNKCPLVRFGQERSGDKIWGPRFFCCGGPRSAANRRLDGPPWREAHLWVAAAAVAAVPFCRRRRFARALRPWGRFPMGEEKSGADRSREHSTSGCLLDRELCPPRSPSASRAGPKSPGVGVKKNPREPAVPRTARRVVFQFQNKLHPLRARV